MGLTANVVSNTPILSSWGNEIRDRSVQNFATAAERTSQWVSPPEGSVSYLRDVDSLEYYNGTAWIPYAGPVAIPHSDGKRRIVTADNSLSNPVNAPLPIAADRTALQTVFTKRRAETLIVVTMHAVIELRSGVAQLITLAIHDGVGPSAVAQRHTQVAATTRVNVTGTVILAGRAAGTFTWEPLIGAGAAVIGLFTNTDEISYSITETY